MEFLAGTGRGLRIGMPHVEVEMLLMWYDVDDAATLGRLCDELQLPKAKEVSRVLWWVTLLRTRPNISPAYSRRKDANALGPELMNDSVSRRKRCWRRILSRWFDIEDIRAANQPRIAPLLRGK